jgi:hypothetical protein
VTDNTRISQLIDIFSELADLSGGLERTSIFPNLTVIDAAPANLPATYIIIQDQEGFYIPALKVPGVTYANGDLVNVLYIKGTEPIAFMQGSGSSGGGGGASIWPAASIINKNGVDQTNVDTAITNVSAGEELRLGTGSFPTTTTTFSKANISLIGSGIDQTVITQTSAVAAIAAFANSANYRQIQNLTFDFSVTSGGNHACTTLSLGAGTSILTNIRIKSTIANISAIASGLVSNSATAIGILFNCIIDAVNTSGVAHAINFNTAGNILRAYSCEINGDALVSGVASVMELYNCRVAGATVGTSATLRIWGCNVSASVNVNATAEIFDCRISSVLSVNSPGVLTMSSSHVTGAVTIANGATATLQGSIFDGNLTVSAGGTLHIRGSIITGTFTNSGTADGWYINSTGDIVDLNLTASRVVITDANKLLASSTITSTDLTNMLTGGTWREATGGNVIKEASIAAAITNASTGDVIHRFPGTETAAQTVNKTVAIYGDTVNETILTQSANATVTVDITAAGVTLKDLTITNTGGGASGACVGSNQTGTYVDGCIISKAAGNPTNGAAVSLNGGTQTFRNCDVSSTSGGSKYGYSISAGAVTIIGGSIAGADAAILTNAGVTVDLQGPKILSGIIDTALGGVVTGWYFDANDRRIDMIQSDMMINGALQVWQRGTSFAAVASGAYTADKFLYSKVGAMVHTVSQSTDVPTVAQAGTYVPFSMLVDCTTVDSSIAAGDYCLIYYAIEGYEFTKVAQRTFSFSFWVKATKTGIYCIAFRNSGNDRSYVAEYTVNVTATWELKTVTIPASPTAGTWNYTTGVGLNVLFTLACGSTFQTTANAWQTGNFFGTSNQVNACDSTSNDFRIAMVGTQLVPSIEDEMERCYRYAVLLRDVMHGGLGIRTGTNLIYESCALPVPMRAVPTLSNAGDLSTTLGTGAKQVSFFNFASGLGLTATGNVTVTMQQTTILRAELAFIAATSFSGAAGNETQVTQTAADLLTMVSADI